MMSEEDLPMMLEEVPPYDVLGNFFRCETGTQVRSRRYQVPQEIHNQVSLLQFDIFNVTWQCMKLSGIIYYYRLDIIQIPMCSVLYIKYLY